MFCRARSASQNTNLFYQNGFLLYKILTIPAQERSSSLDRRISGHICTGFGRYLSNTKCIWIIRQNIGYSILRVYGPRRSSSKLKGKTPI